MANFRNEGQRQARKPVPHSGLGHLLGVPGGGCNGVQQSQEAEASRRFPSRVTPSLGFLRRWGRGVIRSPPQLSFV